MIALKIINPYQEKLDTLVERSEKAKTACTF